MEESGPIEEEEVVMFGFRKKVHGGGIRRQKSEDRKRGRQVLCKQFAVSLVGWLCLLNISAWGQFSGGSGTQVDPYLISTSGDLKDIGDNSVYWDKHFRLMGD
ncbi:MAG: hypothetical protein IID32_01755, partial [Planctomycetes bacterium]|nr:hypothetical protein [Planctomycetota bacterium]